MKRLVLLYLVILLLTSCDRFEHEPYVNLELESDLQLFFSILSSANENDLDTVLDFYSDDYLNNKMNKADIEHSYANYFLEYGNELVLSGETLEYWNSGQVVWNMSGSVDDSLLFAEKQKDNMIKTDNGYIFYGNQVSPPELDPAHPVVLVQFFTSTPCPNCPDAAMKLEEMYNEYGEQLIFLEYVRNSDPGNMYSSESEYYGILAEPTSIFQGQYWIMGAVESSLNEYEIRYEQIATKDIVFRFTELDLSVNGSTISGQVRWEIFSELTDSDLMIKAILLEEDPDLHYVYTPSVYFDNRVLAGFEIPFNDTQEQLEITLEQPDEVTEKLSVIVWLQNIPEIWNSNEGKVYNVIKRTLEVQ